jgi:hypothetical protein
VKAVRSGVAIAVLSLALAGTAAAAPAPTVSTEAASGVAATSATLNGTINPNGADTTWYFEYGTSTKYGQKTPTQDAGAGTAQVSVSAAVSGLQTGRLYHYRLDATSSGGTSQGADQTFTPSGAAAAPTVTISAVTGLSGSAATLNGSVNPNGADTSWYFEFGTSTSYGTKTPAKNIPAGTHSVNVSAPLAGLSAGTTYHFRLVASNSAGTVDSGDQTFSTAGAASAAPAVVTSAATAVSGSSATLHGSVTANSSTTSWYFEYGTSTNYGTKTAIKSIPAGTRATNVSAAVNGLSGGTTYHFRLAASNGSGATAGSDQTFTTSGPPSVQTGSPQSVTTTSATLTGSVNPQGHGTSWYFEYGTTTAYGTKTPAKNAGAGSSAVSVSAPLAGLAPGTTYHFRLIASSSVGTSSSADATFATLGSLTLKVSTYQVVYGGSVGLSGTVSGGQSGVRVTLLAYPYGAGAFKPVATVVTVAGGTWSAHARPGIQTSYQASANGSTSAALTVGVAPAVSLSVITRERFSTKVKAGKSFAGKDVQLQRLQRGHWTTVAKAKLNSSSAATFSERALPRGTSNVRIAFSVNQAGAGYLAGFSRTLVYHR